MRVNNGVLSNLKEKDFKLLQENPRKFWKNVTILGCAVFSGNKTIDEINIPEGVVRICGDAFSFCINLKKIKLPESLTLIDDYAFNSCENLQEIVIPKNILGVGECVFVGCNKLKKITLKNKNIGVPFLKTLCMGFDFDTIETNDDEMILIRNIEEEKEVE